MKTNYLLVLLTITITHVIAQCPMTITGPKSVCSGQSATIIGSGATTYTWSNNVGATNTNSIVITPLTTTTLTLYGNTGACLDSVQFLLNVYPTPTITASAHPTNICSGQTSTLVVSGATTYTWSTGQNFTAGTVTPTSNTTYTVAGSDGNCSSNSVILVNVAPSPTVSYTLIQNSTPHVWDVYPTYNGGKPPYTYSWNWGDGSPNSTSGYPSHTYSTAGWYNICSTLTDANGCISTYCQNNSLYKSSSSSAIVTINVINGIVGIYENTKDIDRTSIYPNPTSDYFFIDSKTKDKLNFELFDVNGRYLFSQSINDKAYINTSNLYEGVYTLIIKTTDSVVIKKLIILR